ncbi:response regulator transcription factor [Vibrio fluvialis]|uniref:response regulator transcription factor n=1 Tax=Vibrio fluvialis TaxID=676 RepID=UPI001559B37F|nr:response regulator transcription factor [Vibrio fluvialis]
MRILLVEDDHMIGEVVEQELQEQHFAVDWVKDGNSATLAADTHHYEVVLLDLGLPQKHGFDVLRHLRDNGNHAGVIIMTAQDATEDKIKGLDLGADDYLIKPFEMGELIARIKAVARRKAGHSGPIYSNGVISLNPATHETDVNGESIRMTAREFSVLQALLQRPGTILSRSDLEERIYGWHQEVESNVIEFIISSLRKKLGCKTYIINVRGVGWMVSKNG